MNYELEPWPDFSQEEVDAVIHVLNSGQINYWTGKEGRNFEHEFAAFCGTKHAVALSNGTVALELALRALNIGSGDEVIVTPRTFIASASAIALVGASPVFIDIDACSQNITPDSVREAITNKTKAIMAVHLGGWPCDMDGLMSLAKEKNLYVIEDCAQAHGALYKQKPVGGFGHVAAWSFCQDKIMSTGGEGGMLTTNDPIIWERVWSGKDHGKSWDAVYNQKHPPGFRWLHESFGTNARMTEMQAAIGRLQIKRMTMWHAARKQNASLILNACDQFPSLLRVPRPPDFIEHAWYKCYVFVRPEGLKLGWSRDRIMKTINANGIPCYSGSCSEIYLEEAFGNTDWQPSNRLPVAKKLGETSLMFLVHPTLSDMALKKTCLILAQVMTEASKLTPAPP